MPILRGNQAGSARDNVMRLADFAIPEEEKTWLVDALGGETFSSEKLDSLEEKGGLTRAQRDLIAGMQLSRRGNLRGADSVVVGADGIQRGSELEAPMRAAASMLHGLAELEGRVREQMPRALVGQHHTQAAFEKMAAAHESVVRRPPPLMALVGRPGHGKDEAVSGYTKALFGEEAEPIAIDVSSFDKPEELQAAIAEAMEKLPEGGVVRFTGVEDLATAKPKHAKVLLAHLSTHRQDLKEPRVSYFLDFDDTFKSPRQATTAALSAMGNRLLSAEAGFCLLDAEAMRIYAKRLLPELMSVDGMDKIRLDWTPAALDLLGEMLATPHAPLIDLEQRLTESVLIAVSVRKSVDPRDVVRIDVARPVAKDAALKKELLEALHEEAPDYFKAAELFTSLVVANQGIDLDREAKIAAGHANLASLLEQAAAAVPGTTPKRAAAAKKELAETAGKAFRAAAQIARGISDAALHCIDENRQVVVPPALRKKLVASLTELLGADLGHIAKEPLVRAALTTAAVGWGMTVTNDLMLTVEELDEGVELSLKGKTYALVAAELAANTNVVGDGVDVSVEADRDDPWSQGFTLEDPSLRLVRVSADDDVTTTLTTKRTRRQAAAAAVGRVEKPAAPKQAAGIAAANVVEPPVREPPKREPPVRVEPPVVEPPKREPPVRGGVVAQNARPIAVQPNELVELGGARALRMYRVPVFADGIARLRVDVRQHDVVRIGNETGGTLYTREGSEASAQHHKNELDGVGKTRFGSEHGRELYISVEAPDGAREVTVTIEKVGEWLAWQDVNIDDGDGASFSFPCDKDAQVRVALNQNNGVQAAAFAVDARGRRVAVPLMNGIATMPLRGDLELELSGRDGAACRLFVEKLIPEP